MHLIYFLSFAQLEEKRRKTKDCYGFAEAFIFHQMIIIVIIMLSVQDLPIHTMFLL